MISRLQYRWLEYLLQISYLATWRLTPKPTKSIVSTSTDCELQPIFSAVVHWTVRSLFPRSWLPGSSLAQPAQHLITSVTCKASGSYPFTGFGHRLFQGFFFFNCWRSFKSYSASWQSDKEGEKRVPQKQQPLSSCWLNSEEMNHRRVLSPRQQR